MEASFEQQLRRETLPHPLPAVAEQVVVAVVVVAVGTWTLSGQG